MSKFAEQARAKDRVEARGKIEEVTTKGGDEYLRLLLESRKDYLVKV
jgi:predicted nucleotidyltransferase